MQEQGFFSKNFVGKDGFQWWVGQVAPEPTWKNNIPGVPGPDNNHERGFGERYRVRIMGHHTSDAAEIPDDVLPYAYVMYPVTAGGGGRGSSVSANIAQGNFVFGFWLDGEDSQTPIIMGCLGYNDYQAVMKSLTPLPDKQSQGTLESAPPAPVLPPPAGDGEIDNNRANTSVDRSLDATLAREDAAVTAALAAEQESGGGESGSQTGEGAPQTTEEPAMDLRFIPYSGYLDEEKRGTHDIKAYYDTSSLILTQDVLAGIGDDLIQNPFAIESSTNTNNITSFSDWAMHEWGKISEPLDQPEDCQPVPMGKIMSQVQTVMNEIDRVTRSLTDYRYALSGLNADAEARLQYLSAKASRFIASGMKWILASIEQNTINVANEAMKPLYFALMPNQRPELKKGVEAANDGIACAFQKAISGLTGMASGFVGDILSKAINIGGGGGGGGAGGGGAISGMISNVIGQVTGMVSGVIGNVLGPISSLVGNISSIGNSVMGFLGNILSFLSCDEKQACTSVNEWSMWTGAGTLPATNLDQIVSGAKDVYEQVTNVAEQAENLPGQITDAVGDFEFDVNFENSLNTSIISSTVRAPGSIVENTTLFTQFPTTNTVKSRAFIAGTPTNTLRSSTSSFVIGENEFGEFIPVPVASVTEDTSIDAEIERARAGDRSGLDDALDIQ